MKKRLIALLMLMAIFASLLVMVSAAPMSAPLGTIYDGSFKNASGSSASCEGPWQEGADADVPATTCGDAVFYDYRDGDGWVSLDVDDWSPVGSIQYMNAHLEGANTAQYRLAIMCEGDWYSCSVSGNGGWTDCEIDTSLYGIGYGDECTHVGISMNYVYLPDTYDGRVGFFEVHSLRPTPGSGG